MSRLVEALDLSGRLQCFHVQSLARDFVGDQVAAIRLHWIPNEWDISTEISLITALLPTHVAAFGGTSDGGNKWIVVLERAPDSPGERLSYFAERGKRPHTFDGTSTTIHLTDAELRAIYAGAGAGPETDHIGFTSLLIGLQAEAFGYPLPHVVSTMNADCAYPDATEHDCEGSFFADIGAAWSNQTLASTPADESDDPIDSDAAEGGAMFGTGNERADEISLTNPDGSQWTYRPFYGERFSPGETGWILTMTGPNALDRQPVSLTDMLGDFHGMGLGESTAPQLAIALTEAIADSLREGHVADRKHPNEPSAEQRLAQVVAELADARFTYGDERNPSNHVSEGVVANRVHAPSLRPLDNQTDEEFIEDSVDTFRRFLSEVTDRQPDPEADPEDEEGSA